MNDRLPPYPIPERGQKLDPGGAAAVPAPTASTPPPPPPPPSGHKPACDARRTTLIEAYWKLRDHADGYRDTNGYRRAQERAKTGTERDGRQAAMHRAFARGISAAGEDIAAMLGIPEHEIERPEVTP